MGGGSILERHGERHIQVNGDLPLPLGLFIPLNYTGKVQKVSTDDLKLFLNVKLSMDVCNHYPQIMHIIHEFCSISMNHAVHYLWIVL